MMTMSKPKSKYKWTMAWAEDGRVIRAERRSDGRVLGICPRSNVEGTMTWEAVIIATDGEQMVLGQYSHWTFAKRAVMECLENRERLREQPRERIEHDPILPPGALAQAEIEESAQWPKT